MIEDRYIPKLIANYRLHNIEDRPITNDDIIKAQNGDDTAFLLILKQHVNMIYLFAIRFRNIKNTNFEELFEYGVTTLFEALQKFDFSVGVKFITFAYACLNNAYMTLYNSNKRLNNFEVSDNKLSKENHSFIANKPESYTASLKRALYNKEYSQVIYDHFKNILNEKQFKVISLRYGLFGNKRHKLNEISAILGCATSYVSAIDIQAKKKILKHKNVILRTIDNITTDPN